jgi:hypothetical protein
MLFKPILYLQYVHKKERGTRGSRKYKQHENAIKFALCQLSTVLNNFPKPSVLCKEILLSVLLIFLNHVSTTLNMIPTNLKFPTHKPKFVSPEQTAQLPMKLAVRWESNCYII